MLRRAVLCSPSIVHHCIVVVHCLLRVVAVSSTSPARLSRCVTTRALRLRTSRRLVAGAYFDDFSQRTRRLVSSRFCRLRRCPSNFFGRRLVILSPASSAQVSGLLPCGVYCVFRSERLLGSSCSFASSLTGCPASAMESFSRLSWARGCSRAPAASLFSLHMSRLVITTLFALVIHYPTNEMGKGSRREVLFNGCTPVSPLRRCPSRREPRRHPRSASSFHVHVPSPFFSFLFFSSSLRRWLRTDSLRLLTATSLHSIHLNVRPIGGGAPVSHQRRHINSRPPRLTLFCSCSCGCRPHHLRRLLTVTHIHYYTTTWPLQCLCQCGCN